MPTRGYCGLRQDISQLQGLSVQLVLHAPSAHQSQEMLRCAALSRGDVREQIGLELGGFQTIVPLNTISMVNNLGIKEKSTEHTLGHKSMLSAITKWRCNLDDRGKLKHMLTSRVESH